MRFQITRTAGYVVAVAAVMLHTAGCGGPDSFEECVGGFLVEQNRSEAELEVIVHICRSRFPRPPSSEELPASAVQSITGTADRQSDDGRFAGTIYNPTGWTVIALEVQVYPKPKPGQRYIPLATQRDYHVTDLLIPPKSSGRFSFAFLDPNPDSELAWQVVAAKGYRAD